MCPLNIGTTSDDCSRAWKQNRFQFFTGFEQLIEQKNILILCFSEENTDSTLLLIPKGLMFVFQINTFQSIDQPGSLIYDKFRFILAIL